MIRNWTDSNALTPGTTNIAFTPWDDVTFGGGAAGTAGAVTISNSGTGVEVNSLTFVAPFDGNYEITGETIDFGDSGNGRAKQITVNGTSATISSTLTSLSGAGALTLEATPNNGTVTINANNTTTLTSGVNIGASNTGNLTVVAAQTGALGASNQVTLHNTGTALELADGVTLDNNLVISATGGNKVIRLASGSTNTGTIGAAGKALTVTEGNASFHFDLNARGTTNNATDQILTVASNITATTADGGIDITGDGVVNLTGTNIITNTIRFNNNGSTLRAGSAGALGSSTIRMQSTNGWLQIANGITTNSGSSIDVADGGNSKRLETHNADPASAETATYGGSITLSDGGTRHFVMRAAEDDTLTVTGVITGTGAGGFGTTGNGTVKLQGTAANDFTGGISLGNTSASTWDGTAGDKKGFLVGFRDDSFGTGTITARGGQLQAGNTGRDFSNNIDITGGHLQLGGSQDFELSGLIQVVGGNRDIGHRGLDGVTYKLSGGIDLDDNGTSRNLTIRGTDGGSNGTIEITGDITGGGNVASNRGFQGGTIILSGNNSHANTSILDQVTLVAKGSDNALGTGTVTLDRTGATLELGQGRDFANALTISNAGTVKTLKLEDGATSSTYGGNIAANEDGNGNFDINAGSGQTLTIDGTITEDSNGPGIDKTGDGTVILNNTVAVRQTRVQGGTLLINGNYSGSNDGIGTISVVDGATLGGSGTLNVDLAFGDGTLAPGNSAGRMDIAGDLDLSNSTFHWELAEYHSGNAIQAGSGMSPDQTFDQVLFTGGAGNGNLTFNASTTFELDFALLSGASSGNWDDFFGLYSTKEWLLFGGVNSVTGLDLVTDIQVQNPQGSFPSVGGFYLTSNGGTNVLLRYEALPEPTTFGLLGLVLAAITGFVRPKRRFN